MQADRKDSRSISVLLRQWKEGDENAFDELFSIVYADLRRRAAAYLRSERKDHTLQTTALVHEAYIKLADKDDVDWKDRNHFFAVASLAMRHILVDYARKKRTKKRGAEDPTVPLDEARHAVFKPGSVDLVALDEALTELAEFDGRIAKAGYF